MALMAGPQQSTALGCPAMRRACPVLQWRMLTLVACCACCARCARCALQGFAIPTDTAWCSQVSNACCARCAVLCALCPQGFAIPIDTVKGLVNQILQYGRVIRPVLGIGIAPQQVRWGQPIVHVVGGGEVKGSCTREGGLLGLQRRVW